MHGPLRQLAVLTLAFAVVCGGVAPALADEAVEEEVVEVVDEAVVEEVEEVPAADEAVAAEPVADEEASVDEVAPADDEAAAVEPSSAEEPAPVDEPAPLGAAAPEQDDVPLTARERGTGWYVDGSTLYITGTVPDWTDDDGSFPPWMFVDDITSVSIRPGAKVYTCERMFQGQEEITSIDLRNLDTSRVTSFLGMFWECSGLKTVDISVLDVRRAVWVGQMFEGCGGLTSVKLPQFKNVTSSELYATAMFMGCYSLKTVDLSAFKGSPISATNLMFAGCSSLTSIDLSPFKGKSLYVAGMFGGCTSLKTVDFSGITVVNDNWGQLGTDGVLEGCANLESFTIPAEWPMTGRRWISLGSGNWVDTDSSIPAATTSNGKWWSVRDRKWYTVEQIKTQRAGIADTYKNDDGTGAYATRPIFRMYNTRTSEHLYTTSAKEYSSCGSGNYSDWEREGIAWRAPKKSSRPVYRLYNVKSGDHHYTTSAGERSKLLASGTWRDEGIAFYSAPKGSANAIPLYRVYNGRLKRGQHHYTRSAGERDALVSKHGWRNEGVGFYGYKA